MKLNDDELKRFAHYQRIKLGDGVLSPEEDKDYHQLIGKVNNREVVRETSDHMVGAEEVAVSSQKPTVEPLRGEWHPDVKTEADWIYLRQAPPEKDELKEDALDGAFGGPNISGYAVKYNGGDKGIFTGDVDAFLKTPESLSAIEIDAAFSADSQKGKSGR